MVKKIEKIVKLQIPTGKATPTLPVGPALDQAGIDIMRFTKELNVRTADQVSLIIPVVIFVYGDHSFIFITKTPPAAVLLKRTVEIEKSLDELNKARVATVSSDQTKEIAELRMADLNAADVEAAMRMVAGTVRNMGIIVE